MLKYNLIFATLLGTFISTQLKCMENTRPRHTSFFVQYCGKSDLDSGMVIFELPIVASSHDRYVGQSFFSVLPLEKKYETRMRAGFFNVVHRNVKTRVSFSTEGKGYAAMIQPVAAAEPSIPLLLVNIRRK